MVDNEVYHVRLTVGYDLLALEYLVTIILVCMPPKVTRKLCVGIVWPRSASLVASAYNTTIGTVERAGLQLASFATLVTEISWHWADI